MMTTRLKDSSREPIHIEEFTSPCSGTQIAQAILSDLAKPPRRISCMWLYDRIGSELFEQITLLPEYYPSRTEKAILRQVSPALARQLPHSAVVELGSGDCSKISILLDSVPHQAWSTIRYVPVDISCTAVEHAAELLVQRFPGLTVHGMIGDFLTHLHRIPNEGRRIFLFFGSTLGNLSTQEMARFLTNLSMLMGGEDRLILGVDMVKPVAVLEAAYNDSRRVTAAFNRNILRVVNRLTGCDFNPLEFDHLAFFNQAESRIEMHLRATKKITVTSARFDARISLAKDETIHTENSHKFSVEELPALASASNLCIRRHDTDSRGWFSLLHMEKAMP